MEEIWEDIIGFEGLYQVSNLGRVKSLERTLIRKNGTPFFVRERILKQGKDHGNYPCVTLARLKKKFVKPTHRLVAIAFIPNPEGKTEVDHIDCDPTNPRVDNLRWVTSSENSLNPITVQRRQRGSSPIGKGLNARPIIGTSILDGSKIYFARIKDAQQYKFYADGIRHNIQGRTKEYNGYTWEYADKNL